MLDSRLRHARTGPLRQQSTHHWFANWGSGTQSSSSTTVLKLSIPFSLSGHRNVGTSRSEPVGIHWKIWKNDWKWRGERRPREGPEKRREKGPEKAGRRPGGSPVKARRRPGDGPGEEPEKAGLRPGGQREEARRRPGEGPGEEPVKAGERSRWSGGAGGFCRSMHFDWKQMMGVRPCLELVTIPSVVLSLSESCRVTSLPARKNKKSKRRREGGREEKLLEPVFGNYSISR